MMQSLNNLIKFDSKQGRANISTINRPVIG